MGTRKKELIKSGLWAQYESSNAKHYKNLTEKTIEEGLLEIKKEQEINEYIHTFNYGLYPSNYPFSLKKLTKDSIVLMKGTSIKSNLLENQYEFIPLREIKGDSIRDIISKVNKEMSKFRE